MEKSWAFNLSSFYTPFLNTLQSFLGHDNDSFNVICGEDDYGHYYIFKSANLDGIEIPEEVYKAGAQLIQLLNGTLFLIYEEEPKIDNYVLSEDGNPLNYIKPELSSNFTLLSYLDSPVKTNGKPVNDLLQFAKTDQNLRDLLYILGEVPTYHKLYMVFETLKSMAGGKEPFEKIIGEELIKKGNAFTHVANNFEAIGTQARHRNYKLQAPEEPMSLEDAKLLIKHISHIVINEKFGLSLPFINRLIITADDLF